MKLQSINSHLQPYSILRKRKTTVAHAFASALAPNDPFDQTVVLSALSDLEQDPNNLTCVYCGNPAQTWDHLTNLVRGGELNGYGHQIGNLVPCCSACNSAKGAMEFERFIEQREGMSDDGKRALIAKLTAHQSRAKAINATPQDEEERALLATYRKIQNDVVALLEEADSCAEQIRLHRQKTLLNK